MAEASIVIPLREQQDAFLEVCVRSATQQSVPVEVIVVISDRTPASNLGVLRRFGDQIRVLPESAPGFANAINLGFESASTSRVALLLSDDWLEPRALEMCLPQTADVVCAGHRIFRADGVTSFGERRPTWAAFEALETHWQRATFLSHLFVFQRKAFLSVGGVDPTIGLTGADDFDLPWTLLEHGASVALVPEIAYNYRDHDDAPRLSLRSQELQVADLRKILEKHRVTEREGKAILERAIIWFGRTIHEVMKEKNRV